MKQTQIDEQQGVNSNLASCLQFSFEEKE